MVWLALLAVLAKDPDPKLATAKTAWVEPADELGDDKPVAACFIDHLTRMTPLTLAAAKADAEIVLSISAHLPGNTRRQLTGIVGTVSIKASDQAGTILWEAKEDVRTTKSLAAYAAADIPCSLADWIADKLRQAMRKARGK